ncbi:DUF3592 domain-containing protein [Luteolibacter sp. LG18]|uniref:DUF3592 domain-containing protein n=1 Tax=Luteolibacter sp. LG18 TaxID=2819286 RepID=UPI002B293379|nr:hypothetical protein llg_38040 [Luteolibacter sp. LG18]
MKKEAPSPEQLAVFARMKFIFLGLVAVAFLVWEVQDFAASFAAAERSTRARLRTTQERDDARVLRAFEDARRNVQVKVALETEPDPRQETRDGWLTVTAPTEREALDTRAAMVTAMQAAFAREGAGELFDISHAPHAEPVRNEGYLRVRNGVRGLAVAILLAAVVLLARQWKHSGLPKLALAGIAASAAGLVLVGMGDEASGIWMALLLFGPPLGLLGLVGYLTRRVRQASRWEETRARITRSEVKAERHRHAGDTTQVRNVPWITYEFQAGGKTVRGERVSIGMGSADNVDVVVKRYPVGAEVPVYYDPADPEDAVLERKPPVSLGCLWGGAVLLAALYTGGLVAFGKAPEIARAFSRGIPGMRHPLVVFLCGGAGLFCLVVGLWMRRHPRKALPWSRVKGTVVSSATESFTETDSADSSARTRTYYRAVIEYRYQADGQDYHGNTSARGPFNVKIAGARASADAEVARHPAGSEVDVFYNPANPAQSGLNVDTEMVLDGRRSLIVAAVLLAIAVYAWVG